MTIIFQVGFVLLVLVLLVLFVFKPGRREIFILTDEDKRLLDQHVKFYRQLDAETKKRFEERAEQFLTHTRITGVNTKAERIDKLFIAAGAIIPVFAFVKWEYTNLHEVLLYPDSFNEDFDQQGWDRNIGGMVGSGAMQNVMIISQAGLRFGFLHPSTTRNTAIHEFAHLIDKVDGSVDGVPEILLPRQYIGQWQNIMQDAMRQIENGHSDIDGYATTNAAEFFAVCCEYFFQQPHSLQLHHPPIYEMMLRMFKPETGRW